MYFKVILIVLIGLTSAQTIKNNETTTGLQPSDEVRAENNVTIGETNSNSTVIEFFGANEENSTAVDQNVIQKPNITSKANYNENKKNKRYRIQNYSRDPLQSNAQSPNPFLSGAPGARGSRRPGSGLDPQIVQLFQNNPRLRLLAEQNPQIAQQILRNPRLLRDPRIANAIRSQLGNGGGGLLGLLPAGLGAALNPLGIGLGGGQQGPLGGSGINQNDRSSLFGASPGLNRRPVNRNRANEENIGGGYYGNNGNNRNDNNNNEDNSGANEENDANNNKEQDYDNSGQEGGNDSQQEGEEGGDEGQEAQDPSQDPANDPDIQQLQNLGGGVGDNFPEGLFPPGLLSKEDLNEIRKQQEKQAREQAEKERQQQGGGGGGGGNQGGEGQDYDYGNGEDGNEAAEESPEEGSEQGEDNTTPQEEPVTTSESPITPPPHRTNSNSKPKHKSEFGGVRQGSVNNPGVEYDEILDVNAPVATPPSVNLPKSKGKTKINPIPPVIPVPGIQYRGQQPVQPYINPQTGLYQQPLAGQVYGQQPQYQQPIQYYPQYQPNYIPQQQFVPQQYPQQFPPQQQYVGQQPGQYPQQPIYQNIPIPQQGYPPQQPVYNQYPQNLNVRGKQQGYNNPNQFIRGAPALDPNIANHNLNTIPHDDSEDSEEYDNQSAVPNQRLSGHRGRSFQQQPRIFSSSAQNTESSVAFNTTQPSVDSNKFNSDSNATYDDIRQRTHQLF